MKLNSKKIVIVLVIVLVCWAFLILLFKHSVFNDLSLDTSINATNSVFAALAFFGIILTIYLQQQELRLQREELAGTRKEFEIQNQSLKKQRFENTFFNLLNLHHAIVDKVWILTNDGEQTSRAAIRIVYEEFKELYDQRMERQGKPDITKENLVAHRSFVIEIFSGVFQRYEEHINHYVKNFVTMVSLIKMSDLVTKEEKSQYYSIVRSQINSYEIVFMFYHFNVGFGMADKQLFDDLELGGAMNSELLVDIKHSYLFDPPAVVDAVLSRKNPFIS